MIGRAQLLDRLDQHVDVLFLGRPSGEAQQARILVQAQSIQQPLPVAALGPEGVDLDPQRPDDDIVHACLFQPPGDEAAGRHHPVELREQTRPALLDRLLGPFAEMQRRQTRRVRMAEADDGASDALAGLQGALPWRIGIARLDDRRLHRRDPGAPALDRRGPAIAVAERQLGGAQPNHPVRARLVPRARHDQRMADARPIGLDPRLLGQEIAFHAARTGRVQHGGVHQPRPVVHRRRLQGAQRVGDFHVQPRNQPEFAFLDVEVGHAHGAFSSGLGCRTPKGFVGCVVATRRQAFRRP